MSRRDWLVGAASLALLTTEARSAASGISFRPERFGASGDGATNDTAAFQRMAAAFNRAGGGTIELRAGATYVLGRQILVNSGDLMFGPDPGGLLVIDGATAAVLVEGRGATLKFADGLRYGRFNADGSPAPDNKVGGRSIPSDYFEGLLTIRNCTGPVHVRDLVIDGNMANLLIGGQDYRPGDSGWQIPGDGMMVFDNRGGELYENIQVRDCPRDGIMTWRGTADVTASRSRFVNCTAVGCGRLGLSIVGGSGYEFNRCRFLDSGTGTVSSAPASGVDVEPERAAVRDVRFHDCMFSGNANTGFVADGGDTLGLSFAQCRFIGTGAWAAWLNKQFRAEDCLFVGSTNVPYENADPARAGKFVRCTFSDDPRLSPTGAHGAANPLINGAGGSLGENNLYDQCVIDGGHRVHGPALAGSVFRDCTINILPPQRLTIVNGMFHGRNTVRAPAASIANLPNFKVADGAELVVNGRRFTRGGPQTVG